VADVRLNSARGADLHDHEDPDDDLDILEFDAAVGSAPPPSTSMTVATKSTTPPGSTLMTTTGTPTTTTRIRASVWFRDRSLVIYVLL
jgi:hypothetical protein